MISSTILIPVVAVVLFGLAFITKRRFGLIGLSLAAGSVLSTIWNTDASLIVSGLGLGQNAPMTNAVTLSALTLLPSIVLLFSGHSHISKVFRIITAIFYAVVATAFLLVPLSNIIDMTGQSADFYNQINSYKSLIIGSGMIFAVADLLATKTPKHDKKSKR